MHLSKNLSEWRGATNPGLNCSNKGGGVGRTTLCLIKPSAEEMPAIAGQPSPPYKKKKKKKTQLRMYCFAST